MVVASHVWGSQWSRRHVLFRSDNEAVVHILANTVQHSTIKIYLSAVRSLHIEQGFTDPLVDCLHLPRVLRGIKRTQGDTSSLYLPVTDDIMMLIFRALDLSLQTIVCFRQHVI